MSFLTVQSRRIECVRLQPELGVSGSPAIVMLHEGLGSVAMWRDFPQQVANATGCEVVVYSRFGYGTSDLVEGNRSVDFMHTEALHVLPELLQKLGLHKPVLFGHSDGGSIALIHAGASTSELSGVIAMAPHVMVEQLTVTSIAAARVAFEKGPLRSALARYHEQVDETFRSWSAIWLHPDFLQWNIEEFLPSITCPVLAIQGQDDEYGTMEQIDIISRRVKHAEVLKIANCRHSPHRDQPGAVLGAVTKFVHDLMQPTAKD